MNVTYTGRHGELPPTQQRKLDAKFATLAKLVERKGADKGAHVVITTERHLTHAEITVNFYDKGIVGAGSGPDYFTAVAAAIEKAEKQAIKARAKWRDTHKSSKEERAVALEAVVSKAAPAPAAKGKAKKAAKRLPAPAMDIDEAEDSEPQVNRVDHHEKRKPMTLEEAMIAIGTRDYLVYRDADKDRVAVLIRRKDGGFDLVES